MPNLRVDFYESGVGDTILITFPSGGIGIVDAHPSLHASRPSIESLVAGKKVHFVCLTHPHADHGQDLIPILEHHPDVEEFWHTIHEVPALLFGVGQTTNYPSSVQKFVTELNQGWADFLEDLFSKVAMRKEIRRRCLHAGIESFEVDTVDIHCVGPEEAVANGFFDTYTKRLTKPDTDFPDINSLSAILALRFGDSLILLGADALSPNWKPVPALFHRRGLPKACVLKVPHHGAKNSFNFSHRASNYLDLCSKTPKAKSVIFAGDSKHPNEEVYKRLLAKTDVYCLSNGLKKAKHNPLKINMPGAQAVAPAKVCNPVVSFEVDSLANVSVLTGQSCTSCPLH